MTQYKLDTTSLANAISQLEESLNYYHSDNIQADKKLVTLLRAATIQAFEFTYEISVKMIKRYLELYSSEPDDLDVLSFPSLIRTACEQGLLLSDVIHWKQYRHNRSITSHTYDENKAEEVFNCTPEFLNEAKYLLKELNKRAKSE